MFPPPSHPAINVICPRVCPPTRPSVLSSTLTKSGPRTREKESRAPWRWEAHLSPGPSEKLEALGSQREEPAQRGCFHRVLTTWWGRTPWRSQSHIHIFQKPLELLLDSGIVLAAGALEVSRAVAFLPLGRLEGRAGRGASRYRLGVGEGVPRKGEGLWQGRPMEDGVCSLSWLARWPEG